MKKFYETTDEAYRELVPGLINYARKRLIEKDRAIDVVHSAFEKVLKYKIDNPTGHIKTFYVYKLVLRACISENKYSSLNVPLGDNQGDKTILLGED